MRRRVAISCACALPLLLHSLLLAFSDALLERQRAMLVRLWATLGRMCAALPVSAAALLACALALGAALLLVGTCVRALLRRSLRPLMRLLAGLRCAALPLCALLGTLWPVYADRSERTAAAYARAYPVRELESLIFELDARLRREEAQLAPASPSDCLAGPEELARRAAIAYAQAGMDALPIRLARRPQWLEGLRAAGIFIPFTGEAIVSPRDTGPALAFTMLHELAHSQGALREDEANLLALRTGLGCDDAALRWASTLTALRYALNTLRALDGARFEQLHALLSPAARRELAAQGAFVLPPRATSEWLGARAPGAIAASAGAQEPLFVRAGGEGAYDGVVYLLLSEGLVPTDGSGPSATPSPTPKR